ncbi:MAG: DUF1624 domain-containing protein [Christensenellaceae bacterium]|nr:DUF1624 domain-containing protein [Christensenellaceae bacterium]
MEIDSVLNEPNKSSQRIPEIDFFRGLCILLMFVDHFMLFTIKFDAFHWSQSNTTFLSTIVSISQYFHSGPGYMFRMIFRSIILCLFFGISGICCTFSKNNLKRAIRLAIVAVSITSSMYLLSLATGHNLNIYFGIFHCYASCILIYWMLNKTHHRMFLFFAIVLIISSILIGILQPKLQTSNILFPLGIPSVNYPSTVDYSPIFPSIGVFLIGAIIGKTIHKNKISASTDYPKFKSNPLIFIGKHGVAFYIIHIPVLAFIVWILGVIAFGKP